MSTRAEQVEACKLSSLLSSDAHGETPFAYHLNAAAATLTRDGELLDRLKKLLLDMEQDCDARSWAQDIEALMKETSDEG